MCEIICSNPCALSSWAAFLDLIWTSVEEFVPSTRSCSKPSRHKHYPRVTQKLIAKKRLLWKRSKLFFSDLHARWQYRDCVNEFRNNCRELLTQQEETVVQANNLGTLYRHVNQRIRRREPIGALIDDIKMVKLLHPTLSKPTCLMSTMTQLG